MAIKQLIDPNDIHTAAATWSGFIYQGKVALYHVLKLLNNDQKNLKYFLQLDSLEDFAIVKKVKGEIAPITLHQVKAMKSTRYSSYKEAFDKLEKRIDDFPCDGAYFHLAVENEKSVDEIKKEHPKIDIYIGYEGNCFCALEDIDEICESEISTYLRSIDKQHFDMPDLLSVFRNNLESEISGRIIQIHSQNHKDDLKIREGAYCMIIPLTDFDRILRTNPQDFLDNENYYLFLTKELLNQYYSEFCLETSEELEDKGEVLSMADRKKLSDYLQQINGLDTNSLVKFIQSILPNRQVKLKTIKDFKNRNIQQDEFKLSFLQILFELIEPSGVIGSNLSWVGDDNLRYTATAISAGHKSKHAICKSIFKNMKDLDFDVPYESNKLITASIDVLSIQEELNLMHKVEEESVVKKNNIVKWYDIGLISLDNAKEKIK